MAKPKLEVFDCDLSSPAEEEKFSLTVLEEARLAAYELGYQAGWNDATAAQTDETARANQALMLTLQSLSFTWAEARQSILSQINPLIAAIINQLLPQIARSTLAPIILEHLFSLTAAKVDEPIELSCNPDEQDKVATFLNETAGFPIKISADPNLQLGQAHLHFASTETLIDLSRVIHDIAALTESFFTLELESQKNG